MNHGGTYEQARGRTMQPNLKKNSPTSTVPKGWRDVGLCLFVRDWMLNYNSRGLYLYPGLDTSPNRTRSLITTSKTKKTSFLILKIT
jgi:hypothetical protein